MDIQKLIKVVTYRIVHDLNSVMTMQEGFKSFVQSRDITTGEKDFVCYFDEIYKPENSEVLKMLRRKYKFEAQDQSNDPI